MSKKERRYRKGFTEQADGESGTAYHRFLKKHKRRLERRRAKIDPEAPPRYGKYRGYET